MLSRTINRSLVDSTSLTFVLPPTFLLPSRARFFNNTTQHVESSPPPPPPVLDAISAKQTPTEFKSDARRSTTPASITTSSTSSPSPTQTLPTPRSAPPPPPQPSTPLHLTPSLLTLLPLLSLQPTHYITPHIHGKPYLVTVGDTIRLPFLMPGVRPGDVLRLNRTSTLGSRDYTLKGAPYIDERLYECRATVVGTEAEPMRIKEKTKRRNRKVKTVRSKHRYTILRVAEVTIKNAEELKREGAVVVQEE